MARGPLGDNRLSLPDEFIPSVCILVLKPVRWQKQTIKTYGTAIGNMDLGWEVIRIELFPY